MKEKTRYNFLIFACVFLWIIMMGSKNVYTAQMVELSAIFNVAETQVSLAMTYYFITYYSKNQEINLHFQAENPKKLRVATNSNKTRIITPHENFAFLGILKISETPKSNV